MSENAQFQVIPVKNKELIAQFLHFPVWLYRNEEKWSQPINADIESVFDVKKNKHLINGEIARWLIIDNQQKNVGRIAAFYSDESFKCHEQPTGGIGFFECTDNQDAANQLFETARIWLLERGLQAMDGPTNPGMRDSFWGCLVDGFHEPVYNMPFNFPYYQALFENYGFQNFFNQYTYQRYFKGGSLHPVVRRTAERVLKNPDYEFKLIEKGNKQFAIDFKIIYNKAWNDFTGTKQLSDNEALNLLKEMEPIMDERLIIYGYYKGEPIAFFIMMPDIGQITKKFNGKWNLLNKLRFMWMLKRTKTINRVIGRIFGVIPEYQGKGVEGALVIRFEQEVEKQGFNYQSLELNWIGDFNPVMMKVSEFIGGKIYKTHVTYRYLFDRNAEFKRAPLVNMPGNHNEQK